VRGIKGKTRRPWLRSQLLPRDGRCVNLALKEGVVQPPLTANDRSKLLSVRQTKIICLDPPLTSVWPAYASEPFSAFSHPPIQLTRSRPCG